MPVLLYKSLRILLRIYKYLTPLVVPSNVFAGNFHLIILSSTTYVCNSKSCKKMHTYNKFRDYLSRTLSKITQEYQDLSKLLFQHVCIYMYMYIPNTCSEAVRVRVARVRNLLKSPLIMCVWEKCVWHLRCVLTCPSPLSKHEMSLTWSYIVCV